MWWAFGSGVAVGTILGILGAMVLVPKLLGLVQEVIKQTSRSVQYPSPERVLESIVPTMREDPFADATQEDERMVDWMEDDFAGNTP